MQAYLFECHCWSTGARHIYICHGQMADTWRWKYPKWPRMHLFKNIPIVKMKKKINKLKKKILGRLTGNFCIFILTITYILVLLLFVWFIHTYMYIFICVWKYILYIYINSSQCILSAMLTIFSCENARANHSQRSPRRGINAGF